MGGVASFLITMRPHLAALEPGHFAGLNRGPRAAVRAALTVFFEGGPLDRIWPNARSPPDGSRLASFVNLFVARRTDCSETPFCRAISASVNLLVDVNPIVHETATQASRGSVARAMNTSTDLRIFMHSSAASRYSEW
jgi:hypothetical protein